MEKNNITRILRLRFCAGVLSAVMALTCVHGAVCAVDAQNTQPSGISEIDIRKTGKLSHAERVDLQKKFMHNIMYSKSEHESSEITNSKNYIDIMRLTNAGFVITTESFKQVNENFKKGQYNTSVVKTDLFDGDNLNTALVNGFNFALFNNSDGTFVFDNGDPWILQKDPTTKEVVESLLEYIKNTKDDENDKQVYILRKLKSIRESIIKNKKIGKDEYFYLFVDGLEKAYQVCISRRAAQTVLEKYRAKTESEIGTKKVERALEITNKANVGGAFVGVGINVDSSEGATENSFYTIGIGGGTSFCIGADFFSTLTAKFGTSVDGAYTEVFYSLEQVLDSDFHPSAIVTSMPVGKSLLKRKQMQKREKELLSVFKVSVEGFLNAAGIVPISVPVEWPAVTKVQSKQSEKSVNLSAEAAVEALSALGMSVSANKEETQHTNKKMYIDLINEDCSVADGISVSDIIDFLKSSNSEIFLTVQSAINNELKNDKSGIVLPNLVTTILGDIREYNSLLGILSNEDSTAKEKEKAKKTKHNIEKRWISGTKIGKNKGRFAVLKSAIAVAVILRDKAESEKDIGYFRQLYEEINRLTKLQDFSKQKASRAAKVETGRYTSKSSVNGKSSVTVPFVGEGSINVTYSVNKGPVYSDNSKDITVKIKLPTVVDGITGIKTARAALNAFIKQNNSKLDLGDAFLLTDSSLKDYLKLSSKTIPNALKALTVTGYFTMVAGMTKIDKSDTTKHVLPLPGQSNVIVKDKDEWKLKFTQEIFSTDFNLKVELPGISDIKLSNSLGRVKTKISPSTLSFIGNKYNALRQGITEKAEPINNTLWDSFKEGQKHKLLKLFIKMTHSSSNVRYELQCIYNDIMKNINSIKNFSEKQDIECDCNDTFKEFISICNSLLQCEKPKNSAEFKMALILLDKILEFNYRYHFIPEINAAHHI